jgi:hypothetical protein
MKWMNLYSGIVLIYLYTNQDEDPLFRMKMGFTSFFVVAGYRSQSNSTICR